MSGEWFVAFGDHFQGPSPAWVRAITRPGFRHCWAFRFDPDARVWLFVFPTFQRVVVELAQPAEIDAQIAAARAGAIRVLRLHARADGPMRPRMLVTCAGAIAAVVGMRRNTLRPQALFRHLIACGAQPVFTPCSEPDRGKAVLPA